MSILLAIKNPTKNHTPQKGRSLQSDHNLQKHISIKVVQNTLLSSQTTTTHTRTHPHTGSTPQQAATKNNTPPTPPHTTPACRTPHHHITPHMLFPYYVFLHYALPGLIRPAPCLMAALPILSLPPRLKDENRSNRYHALASLISPIITGSFYYRHHPLQNPIHAAPDKISRYPCIYTDKTAEESR